MNALTIDQSPCYLFPVVIEHLLCSQPKSHLLEHNLQNEDQWGFRPKRSTEDALLYMTEKWRKAIDSGKVVGILFIDFKKAFDSVSHQILLNSFKYALKKSDALEKMIFTKNNVVKGLNYRDYIYF